jgi:hypothetical protein
MWSLVYYLHQDTVAARVVFDKYVRMHGLGYVIKKDRLGASSCLAS